MYQQVNLTLIIQWCSGKAVSSYSGLQGSIPSVDVVKFLSTILYYFLNYDIMFYAFFRV